MAKTHYVVLERITFGDNHEGWSLFSDDVEATSATGALRVALNGEGNLGKSYVAVPQRSWQPQPVMVETQHRVKIG